MNVFIVYAHPEPQFLNGSLKNVAVDFLESSGHNVWVSNLYEMNWKTPANGQDFTRYNPGSVVVLNARFGAGLSPRYTS